MFYGVKEDEKKVAYYIYIYIYMYTLNNRLKNSCINLLFNNNVLRIK